MRRARPTCSTHSWNISSPVARAEARAARDDELQKTLVIRLPINEASAKVRTGGPIDDEEDLTLPIWAGVVPLHIEATAPIDAHDLAPGIEIPTYVKTYRGAPDATAGSSKHRVGAEQDAQLAHEAVGRVDAELVGQAQHLLAEVQEHLRVARVLVQQTLEVAEQVLAQRVR